MFDPEEMNEYQKIKAPAYLKEQIYIQSLHSSRKSYGYLLGMVLIVLIMAGCFLFFDSEQPSILVNDQLLSNEPLELIASSSDVYSRDTDQALSIIIQVENKGKTMISVDEGYVALLDSDMNEMPYTDHFVDKGIILWNIDTRKIKDHVMVLEGKNLSCSLLVIYDDEHQIWTICRK